MSRGSLTKALKTREKRRGERSPFRDHRTPGYEKKIKEWCKGGVQDTRNGGGGGKSVTIKTAVTRTRERDGAPLLLT